MNFGRGASFFSAQELADLRLPGLPSAKRKINERAEDEGWALKVSESGEPLARKRHGRGGGVEYHSDVLPPAARLELARRGLLAANMPSNVVLHPEAANNAQWAAFERLPAHVREKAAERLKTLQEVLRLEGLGLTRSAAVATLSGITGAGTSTIWRWFDRVAGRAPHDWLPALAADHVGGGREAEVDPDLFLIFKSDWLRGEKPTFAACYARTALEAEKRGQSLPSLKTMQRKLLREVDPAVRVALRSGRDAVRKMVPPQQRSVELLAPLSCVNIDGHLWDVRVRWPDGTVARPMMVGIQDVYSRKILAWRIGASECVSITRLAFADLFRNFGIPERCLLDNSRTFASKWFTGGAKTRNRFKVKHDEPLGLLPLLGIENIWATPYHGQAKPIERAWRDFADVIAKHPAFEGAYVGKNTVSKPHNYGEKAVDLEVFTRIVAAGIAAHNAKRGRRSEMARGVLSFDEVWREAIERGAVITRATEAQIGLALLAGEQVRTNRHDGSLTLFGNRYWSEALGAYAGQKLTTRFDPENLHSEIRVYDLSGRFLAVAPVIEAVGFLDQDAARAHAKRVSEHRKAVRRAVELEGLISAAELAASMPEYEGVAAPEPKVVRPARLRGSAAAAHATDQFIDQFSARMTRLRVVE